MALKRNPIDYMYDTSTFLGRAGVGRVISDKASQASNQDGGGSAGRGAPRNTKIPVAPLIDRRDINIYKGAGVSKIRVGSIDFGKIKTIDEVTRKIKLHIQEKLPVEVRKIIPPIPPVIISPPTTVGGLIKGKPTHNDKGKKTMALDLGSLLGNLGGAYIDARYGADPGGGYNYAYGPSQSPPTTMPALGIPFVDVIPEASGRNMVYDPKANCGQGKWIKKIRRRRRRLATASDIKDLAALNPVTTPKEKAVWIATHPS